MLVALSADMEGISGLSDPREIIAFGRPYWLTGRRRLTADVAAAARGLLAGGADVVVILDNHGSGNPENILVEELPAGARLETWNVFDLEERGVDAMLQVGYHARAGVASFISHTYVPGLRLRVDGELISESHGRAWAAGLPVLGIIGAEAHERTLGSMTGAPFLAVQRSSSMTEAHPAFDDSAAAIEAFASDAVRGRGLGTEVPTGCLFEASLPESEAQAGEPQLAAAGWQRRTDTEFAIELRAWPEAREPLAAAMAAAVAPWVPYFSTFDLTSQAAAEAVHDDPTLSRGRDEFDAWLTADQPEWLAPPG
jgi:D-aminopeptidase